MSRGVSFDPDLWDLRASRERWNEMLKSFHCCLPLYGPGRMINSSSVPPLGVKIVTEDQPMVAGREYNLKCVSWGSLPPAEISWYRRQSHGAKVGRDLEQMEMGNTFPQLFLIKCLCFIHTHIIPVQNINPWNERLKPSITRFQERERST